MNAKMRLVGLVAVLTRLTRRNWPVRILLTLVLQINSNSDWPRGVGQCHKIPALVGHLKTVDVKGQAIGGYVMSGLRIVHHEVVISLFSPNDVFCRDSRVATWDQRQANVDRVWLNPKNFGITRLRKNCTSETQTRLYNNFQNRQSLMFHFTQNIQVRQQWRWACNLRLNEMFSGNRESQM